VPYPRHPELDLMLVVYVDDFKLSGPAGSLEKGWALIKKHIKTDAPHSVDQFLGCTHKRFTRVLPETGATVTA